MQRTRRSAVVIGAVVGLLLQLAGRADAVTGFGPSYNLTTQRCYGIWTSEGANGATRGFAQCNAHPVVNIAGSGSSWHTSFAPWSGNILSAASDGSTDYALLAEQTGLYLRYRSKDGAYHAGQRLSATRGVEFGDVLVAGGRWWAVWVEAGGLHEAHTLGGSRAAHLIFKTDGPTTARDSDPVLAWSGSQATLVWTHAITQSQVSTRLSSSTGGAWAALRTLSGTGFRPNVAYTGSTVAVARLEGLDGPLRIATFTGSPTGTLSKRLSANSATAVKPQIAYSSGRLNVAWTRYIDSAHNQQVVAERTNGVWSEARLGGPEDSKVLDLTSAGGHARLFVGHGLGYMYARTQQ